MKTISTILFFSFVFSGYAQKSPVTKKIVTTSPRLKNYEDSVQYALGVYMGEYLVKGGFMTLKLDQFLSGLNDRYKNTPRKIGDSLIYPLIADYQANFQNQKTKALEKEMFELLKDRQGVGKLPSGVQYTIIKSSKGPKPEETDSVLIHFKGTLPDGKVFENTFAANEPVLTTPATVIPGLNEVLQLMPVGAIWQAFIPAALAYGEKGNNRIPPNSALMILVELIEIKHKR
ncbi:MAG: FKBP-type peptidyl-prolyl cis-trans isomerase [Bacteroidetes bacterium]|nr:FKBP-type peptidyl-prolyl cis-trans isomerase [Bacteroidota bacterium]